MSFEIRRVGLLLPLLLALVSAVTASPAGAAVPASPSFQLTVRSVPTVLPRRSEGAPTGEPQGFYVATATNLGGAPTSGSVIVRDTLPEGVKAVAEGFQQPTISLASGSGELGTCNTAGQIVTCELPDAVPAGESLIVVIPVTVSPSTSDEVIDTASIEGGGGPERVASTTTTIGAQPPGFDFLAGDAGFSGVVGDAGGEPTYAAGAHPYQMTFGVGFPTEFTGNGSLLAAGEPEAVNVTLPRGLYVNPNAVKIKCTAEELENDLVGHAGCPAASQIGLASTLTSIQGAPTVFPTRPVYAMEPAPGAPAEFAFDAENGVYVHLFGHVGSDGEYELSARTPNIPAKVPILGSVITLWGSPSEASHDQMRGSGSPGPGCIGLRPSQRTCPTERLSTGLITLPSDCTSSPLTVTGEASTWIERGVFHRRVANITGIEGSPVAVAGCNALEFRPTISAQPTTTAGDSPSGLDFNLHQPQEGDYESLATANLKNATATLPEGLTVNPSSARGLGSCSEAQIGLTTPTGQRAPIRFDERPQSCPDSAKLGTVEVSTPLLEKSLSGTIYLAKPFENPFANLITIYLAIEDEEAGIVSKLAGRVTPDPGTGQLSATFSESPELPFEDIDLHFFNGTGSALTTPLACGTYKTTSDLTPWSTPEGADAHPSSSFPTNTSCSSSEAAAPKTVNFTAGTESPLSGSYSPFILRIARPDGSQHITGIETTLPKGLLGKAAGVSYCSEADISQARSREEPEKGELELQSPSCPASSEVGAVNVRAGSGSIPFSASGHAYWAGPYKGAPFSLVTIVPAVAGPFDLGTVVVRVALNVGEYDARIHAVADPLPTIREGIPLDVRSIELTLDRPNFMLNPTSCEAMAIEGRVTTQAGQDATLNNRFQVGECGRLAFKPKLALSLKGPTKRTGHPALKAVVTFPKGTANANISRAQVSLPHSEFLDQGNLGKTCTKPVLAMGACPSSTVYGRATAWSPLLEKPLKGPVFLVGGFGYKLPALVAELDGQIRVLLVGKIDTDKSDGIRSTFEAAPDAPVERFVLEMKGGKKYGLLQNSENICHRKQRAGMSFAGQNGKSLRTTVSIANSCRKTKAKHKKGKHRRNAGRKKG